MSSTNIVRNERGQIRSIAQAEASRLLFGDETYQPHRPDGTFSLGGEWITYNDLVKRIEKATA